MCRMWINWEQVNPLQEHGGEQVNPPQEHGGEGSLPRWWDSPSDTPSDIHLSRRTRGRRNQGDIPDRSYPRPGTVSYLPYVSFSHEYNDPGNAVAEALDIDNHTEHPGAAY